MILNENVKQIRVDWETYDPLSKCNRNIGSIFFKNLVMQKNNWKRPKNLMQFDYENL